MHVFIDTLLLISDQTGWLYPENYVGLRKRLT